MRSNEKFIETDAYRHCIDLLENKTDASLLVLRGKIGIGKTSIGVGIQKYFKSKGWNTSVIYNPREFSIKLIDYSQSAFLMIDNLFGKFGPDVVNLQCFRDMMYDIFNAEDYSPELLVLITVNNEVWDTFKSEQKYIPSLCDAEVVNLNEFELSEKDKRDLIWNYISKECKNERCTCKSDEFLGNVAGVMDTEIASISFVCSKMWNHGDSFNFALPAEELYDKYVQEKVSKDSLCAFYALAAIVLSNGLDIRKDNGSILMVINKILKTTGTDSDVDFSPLRLKYFCKHLHKQGHVFRLENTKSYFVLNDRLFLSVARTFYNFHQDDFLENCSLDILLQLLGPIESSSMLLLSEHQGKIQALKTYIQLEKRFIWEEKLNIFEKHTLGERLRNILSSHVDAFVKISEHLQMKARCHTNDTSICRAVEMVKYHPYLELHYKVHENIPSERWEHKEGNIDTCSCFLPRNETAKSRVPSERRKNRQKFQLLTHK